MTQQDKGKNIFQSAIDAVSNRDEKAAIEAAMKHAQEVEQRAIAAETKLAEAEQRAAQNAQKLTSAESMTGQTAQRLSAAEARATQLGVDLKKVQADLETTRAELTAAKNAASAAEQKLAFANSQLQNYVSAEQAKATAQAQTIAEHTLKADETLSHLALKYYGSAYEPYWRVIYEANKALIGDNPARVRPGMLIKIPVLPEELKKK